MNTIKPDDLHMVRDIRHSFKSTLYDKTNALQLLELFASKGMHYQADMTLLALINDPEITSAYLKVPREYEYERCLTAERHTWCSCQYDISCTCQSEKLGEPVYYRTHDTEE